MDLDITDKTEENYTRSIADIDQQIDETLASVSLESTIVIITAEHGTTFNKLDEKSKKTILVVMKSKCRLLFTGKIYRCKKSLN